ncbi:MAG: ABC-F type ribosomal protection protein [Clostridiales bacterium]|nr:ABC-F type ribosomal protection protein [Clostridiales bacterium]
MILSVQNVSKSFGEDVVLNGVSFHVEDYEKVAIVGINGAGKSTLLKIIVGELEADEGTVTLSRGKTLGYLAQHQEAFGERTIYEEVLEAKSDIVEMEARIRSMEAEMETVPPEETEEFLERYHRQLLEYEARDGYALKSEVSGIIKGLGFSENEFDKPCKELSGGQKTRVALARLLVTRPDIILLDEPTNHLDIASITWLETFLINYRGAVVVVAHDRYFLDRVVTKVVEISLHKSMVFNGNYSYYAQRAQEVRQERLRAYMNQQREIKHQEEVIERLQSFNREKSIKRAESRKKKLARMEVIEKPGQEHSKMHIRFTPAIESGKDVLAVEDLAKSYGDKHLFSDISFDIQRGERVALIGENGTGKTTILKIINQIADADAGEFRLGTNVCIGYYDQEQQELHMEKSLFDEIGDDYPWMTETEIRNILAAFLFTGDEAFRLVGDLSGGERGRLSLAKLMLSEANFLILDEPTNHLDIASREILEDALTGYGGTVFFVSHDRYFINRTATRILNLSDGCLTNYLGNYDYYLEKRDGMIQVSETVTSGTSPAKSEPVSDSKADWQAKKEEQARLRKLNNDIAKTESDIAKLEARLKEIDAEYEKPYIATDPVKLSELGKEQSGIDEVLEKLYDKWDALNKELDEG